MTPGERAYETKRNYLLHCGLSMLQWSDLSPDMKIAEECAAAAVVADVQSELAAQRAVVEPLVSALEHMSWCRSCGESAWEDCDGGRLALEALAAAEAARKEAT